MTDYRRINRYRQEDMEKLWREVGSAPFLAKDLSISSRTAGKFLKKLEGSNLVTVIGTAPDSKHANIWQVCESVRDVCRELFGPDVAGVKV